MTVCFHLPRILIVGQIIQQPFAIHAFGQLRVKNGEGGFHPAQQIAFQPVCRGTIPVSYTHLDVYKRQVLLPVAHAQSAAGQTAQIATPTPTTTATTPGRHPLLWKVSDADNAVYLLGAFHLLKADDYPLPAEIDRAFEDSQQVLFEVEPAALTAPESVAKICLLYTSRCV